MARVSLPFNFIAGTTAVASQVDQNFQALANAINGNIDNQNVGALGFYASQILPLTPAEATFGGNQTYAFPAAILAGSNISAPGGIYSGTGFYAGQSFFGPASAQVEGPVQAIKAAGTTLATVPPFVLPSGNDIGTGAHRTGGQVGISVNNSANFGFTGVSLIGDAAFTNAPTVMATAFLGSPSVPGWTSGARLEISLPVGPPYTTIGVFARSQSGSNSVSIAAVQAYWQAEGV